MLLVAVAVGALTMAVLAVLRPELPSRLPPRLLWGAAAAGAVAVGLSDAAPTGWEPLDLLLRAGFGALVPLAAARATVATGWLLVVATATLLVADAPAEAVAALAAGAFLSLMAAGATTPPAAAIAAAAGIGPLAHADWPLAAGASAGAMAMATVPVLLVGIARAPRSVRTRAMLASMAVVVVLGIGAVVGLVSALSARTDVDAAVDLATTGIDLLGDDDDAARVSLLDAAAAFESADDTLRVWWAKPALLVPGVAQQSRAVSTMASAGAELARTAADATEEADVDSVRPRNGRVDLDALAALSEPLNRSLDALQRADARLRDVDSPLLLDLVADRLDRLQTEVDDALGSAELAAQAVEVAPQLLGADGPRRYFIAFQNPAESTANGGFMGNWAELVADEGQLTLTHSGRSRELSQGGPDPKGRHIEGEPEFVSIYGQSAAELWGNINFTPDHPTVSRIMAQLYPQSGGEGPVDGVIAMTPAAMAALLDITGPIEVPGYPDRLSSDNAERIMLHEQYLQFAEQSGEDREDFLADAVEVLFDELTSGELPGPRAIAEELSPAVAGRDLQLWSVHPEEQALFERMGIDGSATRENVDSFGVVTQNLNGNKIDWFLHRDISYDARWDPESGEVTATLTATIRNDAPPTGLPAAIIGWGGDESAGQTPVADGENLMWMTIYATHPIDRVTLDGEPVDVVETEELGHQTARFVFAVPSESERTVVAELRGVVNPAARYELRALRQPMVNADVVEARIGVPDPWELSSIDGEPVPEGEKHALSRQDAKAPLRMAIEVARTDAGLDWLDRLRGDA